MLGFMLGFMIDFALISKAAQGDMMISANAKGRWGERSDPGTHVGKQGTSLKGTMHISRILVVHF